MSEERDEADEISCDVEQWLIFGVKGFRSINEAMDTIEARIRAYGDTREQAGLERARRECRAARAENTSGTMFNRGFDRGTQVCEERIDALPVPAPDAKGGES